MNSQIKDIKAREILDSRGNPTIEVDCVTESGIFTAAVPSGASTGSKEAFELRDKDKRYNGKGVLKAVKNVNEIIGKKIIGMDCQDQKLIDDAMSSLDGTEGKYNLGANAIVGVSMAVCRAGANVKGLELYEYIAEMFGNKEVKLPKPLFNILNGGAHADNNLDFQEFMIYPESANFGESLRMGAEIYHNLKKVLKENYPEFAINVGDEGGFAPPIEIPEVALGLIVKAVEESNYRNMVKIVLDVAASEFYRIEKGATEGYYGLNKGVFNRIDLLNYYSELVRSYPIIGIEDPFSESDWKGFERITDRMGKDVIIVGDDLLVSNPKIIKEAKKTKACNAVILKINQIGTVSEILEAARLAKEYNWQTIVSHRSGETIDSFISDLAVGISSDYIKSGAPARGERLAKYNRLCKIEEKLKN